MSRRGDMIWNIKGNSSAMTNHLLIGHERIGKYNKYEQNRKKILTKILSYDKIYNR